MTGLRIEFVCTGNICRSPMAEAMLRDRLKDLRITNVDVTSSGIGSWHVGQLADERARAELQRHGYDSSGLIAEQISPRTFESDAIIALDTRHRSELIARGADPERVYLLRDFDPHSPPNSSVADPYYGGPQGFSTTREQIEAALDGIIAWIEEKLGQVE